MASPLVRYYCGEPLECYYAGQSLGYSKGVVLDDDPRLSQAFDLIREVVADAYKRGVETGAVSSFTGEASGGVGRGGGDLVSKRRSPDQGKVRRLIDRTLKKYAPQGINVAGIYGCRAGRLEESISLPRVRAELQKGLIEGRYRLDKGCWFLITSKARR